MEEEGSLQSLQTCMNLWKMKVAYKVYNPVWTYGRGR